MNIPSRKYKLYSGCYLKKNQSTASSYQVKKLLQSEDKFMKQIAYICRSEKIKWTNNIENKATLHLAEFENIT